MLELEISAKERLGNALTELGVDGKFLSENKHGGFRLQEKADLIAGIVSKKLEFGNWQDVVEMVYGREVGQLYDRDRKELEREIIKSAKKNSRHGVDGFTKRILKEKSDGGLLFNLANLLSSEYEEFTDAVNLDLPFFNDAENSERRERVYNKIAAKKALDEGRVNVAFRHLKKAGAQDKINNLFDKCFAEDTNSWSLIQMALTDSENREKKLRRLVVQNKVSPVEGFKLYKKHGLDLTERQKKNLINKVAGELDRVDKNHLESTLGFHYDWQCPEQDEIKLLWAKKHAKSNPNDSYFILKGHLIREDREEDAGFESYIDKSVIAGLKLQSHKSEYERDKALHASQVDKKDLERIYSKVDFGNKVNIAKQLEDNYRLKELSEEASEKGDFDDAYNLWINAEGDLNEPYFMALRKKVVDKSIAEGFFWSVNKFDLDSQRMVFDGAIEKGGLEERAYDIAWSLQDEDRLSIAREAMVEKYGVREAFNKFLKPCFGDDVQPDKDGVDYALSLVAKKYGMGYEELIDVFV